MVYRPTAHRTAFSPPVSSYRDSSHQLQTQSVHARAACHIILQPSQQCQHFTFRSKQLNIQGQPVFLSTDTSSSARSFYIITNRDKKYSLVQIWNYNLNSTIESQVLSQVVKSKLWYAIYTQFLPITMKNNIYVICKLWVWKRVFFPFISHYWTLKVTSEMSDQYKYSFFRKSSFMYRYVVKSGVRLKYPRKQKQSIMSPNRWF